MRTSTAGGGATDMVSAFKRMVGGGTLFMTEYVAEGRPGMVAFATKLSDEIRPVLVGPAQEYTVHRHGFLAGTAGVELSIAFQQSFGAGPSARPASSCSTCGARAPPRSS
jgi:uncharacterized protein (AIM24 family)